MAIDIVRGAIKNQIASADLIETISGVQNEYTGTLFLAYPLSATAESVVTIDALLVTKEKGEYYGAAEPPVRCGESHLSGLTEPLHFVY